MALLSPPVFSDCPGPVNRAWPSIDESLSASGAGLSAVQEVSCQCVPPDSGHGGPNVLTRSAGPGLSGSLNKTVTST